MALRHSKSHLVPLPACLSYAGSMLVTLRQRERDHREAHVGTRRRRKDLFRSEKQKLLEALRICRKAVIESHVRVFPRVRSMRVA